MCPLSISEKRKNIYSLQIMWYHKWYIMMFIITMMVIYHIFDLFTSDKYHDGIS